ncbi:MULTISPECIES: DUF397 domain-containing protein [Bacteria]|uniref:DUF397 domain-containing protein n=1 Tax=Streptomyces sindenensis TaxID=67363 RepID=A0ABW6ET47_9ACTN
MTVTPPAFDPDELSWFKATASSDHGACVEVAQAPESWVAVRDSKNTNGPVLAVPGASWAATVNALRSGAL